MSYTWKMFCSCYKFLEIQLWNNNFLIRTKWHAPSELVSVLYCVYVIYLSSHKWPRCNYFIAHLRLNKVWISDYSVVWWQTVRKPPPTVCTMSIWQSLQCNFRVVVATCQHSRMHTLCMIRFISEQTQGSLLLNLIVCPVNIALMSQLNIRCWCNECHQWLDKSMIIFTCSLSRKSEKLFPKKFSCNRCPRHLTQSSLLSIGLHACYKCASFTQHTLVINVCVADRITALLTPV